jgi:hypothetical protein
VLDAEDDDGSEIGDMAQYMSFLKARPRRPVMRGAPLAPPPTPTTRISSRKRSRATVQVQNNAGPMPRWQCPIVVERTGKNR